MSLEPGQPHGGTDPVILTTNYCEHAALSCLGGAAGKDPSAMVQHHAFWLDGVQKALQARHYLDRRVLELSIGLEANKILDVGCGFGCTIHYLHESRTARYSGITLSRLEHTLGTEAIEKKNLQHDLRIFCADCHDALSWRPFPAQDLVYALESFRFSWNPGALFSGIHKSLRQDGLLAVADFFLSPAAVEPGDEKLAHALQLFRQGYHCAGLPVMDSFIAQAAGHGLELQSRESLKDGLRDGLLERLGAVIPVSFGLAPEVKAWRQAEHAAAAQIGQLVRNGLLDFGFLVFRKVI